MITFTCTHSSPPAPVFKSQRHVHSLPDCPSPSHARLSSVSPPTWFRPAPASALPPTCLCFSCPRTLTCLLLSLEFCLTRFQPCWPLDRYPAPRLSRPRVKRPLFSHPAFSSFPTRDLVLPAWCRPAGPGSPPLAVCATEESPPPAHTISKTVADFKMLHSSSWLNPDADLCHVLGRLLCSAVNRTETETSFLSRHFVCMLSVTRRPQIVPSYHCLYPASILGKRELRLGGMKVPSKHQLKQKAANGVLIMLFSIGFFPPHAE